MERDGSVSGVALCPIPFCPFCPFCQGSKLSFKDSGCVVYVLKPTSSSQAETLDAQIRAVRRLVLEEIRAELCTNYLGGEKVTILSGPLQGISGIVMGTANARRLVVSVDMLGVGVSVVLDADTDLTKAVAASHIPVVMAERGDVMPPRLIGRSVALAR